MRSYAEQITAVAVAMSLAACGTVAITGRSQINIVSDSVLTAAANENFSTFMTAAYSKNAVMESTESPESAKLIALVNRVSNKIIDAAGLQYEYNWQVSVIKSSIPNAFVMPNGQIVVFTGILPIAKTEAGLAAVIGHEVAHVVAHHSAERMSQALITQTALETADAIVAAKNPKNRPIIAAALGIGAQYGLILPFSRKHESEADRIGQIYMAKAGYDPAEAVAVWVRMAANSNKSSMEFTSTHPTNETRQEQLRQWLPEAALYYADRSRSLPASLTEIQTARLESEQRNLLAPVAPQPEIREGYWYKVRSLSNGTENTYKYDKFEPCAAGTCVSISSTANAKRTITNDFRIARIENPNSSWTKFTPPVRQIRFPVRVGDSWEDIVEMETSDGKKRTVKFKSQTVAYEEVSVPAGNFMAYKIVSAFSGTRFSEGWFSPEVRGMIKTTSFSPTGESTVELIDFQKSNDLIGSFSAP